MKYLILSILLSFSVVAEDVDNFQYCNNPHSEQAICVNKIEKRTNLDQTIWYELNRSIFNTTHSFIFKIFDAVTGKSLFASKYQTFYKTTDTGLSIKKRSSDDFDFEIGKDYIIRISAMKKLEDNAGFETYHADPVKVSIY